MKIYKLEFSFFCGVQWGTVNVEITAVNKIQLIRAFLDVTIYVTNQSQKQLWKTNKKYIEESVLIFPLVKLF